MSHLCAPRRDEVYAGGGDVQRYGAESLNRVDEQRGTVGVAQRRHLGERHLQARLKLNSAHGDHPDTAPVQRGLQPAEVGATGAGVIGQR